MGPVSLVQGSLETSEREAVEPPRQTIRPAAFAAPYGGHCADGSGIQKHSVGDTYPYVLCGYEFDGRTWYGWVNHQRKWASKRFERAAQADKHMHDTLALGSVLHNGAAAAFRDNYTRLQGIRFRPLSQTAKSKRLFRAQDAFAASVIWQVKYDDGRIEYLTQLPLTPNDGMIGIRKFEACK